LSDVSSSPSPSSCPDSPPLAALPSPRTRRCGEIYGEALRGMVIGKRGGDEGGMGVGSRRDERPEEDGWLVEGSSLRLAVAWIAGNGGRLSELDSAISAIKKSQRSQQYQNRNSCCKIGGDIQSGANCWRISCEDNAKIQLWPQTKNPPQKNQYFYWLRKLRVGLFLAVYSLSH
jgi:hypothetical protein